ncbi:MAG: hypothetical protein D6775_10855, partial [Caldilineae bacterium]
HDDLAKPHGRGTEVRTLIWDGAGWSDPMNLTDDQQPDVAPVAAFDGRGHGLVVWERSKLTADAPPTLNRDFVRSLEIAASVWDGEHWSEPAMLTDNELMDHALQLATGADGAVMALWRTNDGEDILGNADHPLTLTYAIWDGENWSEPAAALTGLQSVINAALAMRSATQAALVYAQDMDGDLTTADDAELFYSLYDGAAWSEPQRLTDDAVSDGVPALAYDAAGALHLVWLRDGDLVWLHDSWNAADARVVRAQSTAAGFLGFTLNRAANGNLALVWQSMGPEGADLTYSIYDATADDWSADLALMSDASVEASHSPAFGGDGTLYLAYQKVATDFVTRTIEIEPGQPFTVTNVPQPGQADLVFLEHTVAQDLTLDDFSVSPANPAPGQPITLTAVLRNAGDLMAAAPQVTFYDGDAPIAAQTLPDLSAGYTTTVQATWTLPLDPTPHILRAVADPEGQVAESDETNNELTLQTTLPDLAVDLVTTVYETNWLTFTTRLVNQGALDITEPFSVTLRANDPVTGTIVGLDVISDTVAAGQAITATHLYPAAMVRMEWADSLWVVVDDGDRVAEADEGNNTSVVRPDILPDLSISDADIHTERPQLGGLYMGEPFTITIHNSGYFTATDVLVEVREGEEITGTLLYQETLPLVAPGATGTVTMSLTESAPLLVMLDPENSITELDESNNLATGEAVIVAAGPYRYYLPMLSVRGQIGR